MLTVKVTLRLLTGEKPLRTAEMVVFPFVRMEEAVAETVMVGTVATGLIVTFACPEMPPRDGTEVVMVTLPAAFPVRTDVATPFVSVAAVDNESEARVLLFRLKFTVALATGLPLLSLTVAVILDVFPAVIADGDAVTVTLPPETPAVIVIEILADALPDAALTVAMALEKVVAVTVTVARPFTVCAWPLDKLAFT